MVMTFIGTSVVAEVQQQYTILFRVTFLIRQNEFVSMSLLKSYYIQESTSIIYGGQKACQLTVKMTKIRSDKLQWLFIISQKAMAREQKKGPSWIRRKCTILQFFIVKQYRRARQPSFGKSQQAQSCHFSAAAFNSIEVVI